MTAHSATFPLRQAAQAHALGAVERDAEARARWRHVYPELVAGLPGLAGAITGRAAAQVTR